MNLQHHQITATNLRVVETAEHFNALRVATAEVFGGDERTTVDIGQINDVDDTGADGVTAVKRIFFVA